MSINTLTIAKNHSIVTLTSEKYEGNKTIKKEEMAALLPGLDSDAINKKVVSTGSKKLYNPTLLNEGEKLKTRAIAALEKVGVKHTGRRGVNYVVANDILDELLDELEGIQAEYFAWVSHQFSDAQYQKDLQEWADDNPGLSEVILAASPTAYQVRNRFTFELHLEDISASDNSNQSDRIKQAKEQTASSLVGSLGDRLLLEVSQLAERTLVKSVDGASKLTRRVLSPAKTIAGKLRGLSMLTPLATPLADHIDSQLVIASDGGSKPLTSAQVATIVALYQMLSKPAQIEDFMLKTGKLEGGEETLEEDAETEVQEELTALLEQPIEGAEDVTEAEELPEPEVTLQEVEATPESEMVEAVTETAPVIEIELQETEVAEEVTEVEVKEEAPQPQQAAFNLAALL